MTTSPKQTRPDAPPPQPMLRIGPSPDEPTPLVYRPWYFPALMLGFLLLVALAFFVGMADSV